MTSRPPLPTWAIAVFAHNEGNSISRCLDSILAATQSPEALRVYVLNNGSSDNTSALVMDYSLNHPQVQLVEIQLGDKANAWNHFVHDLSPQADVFGFVDGDVTLTEDALDELRKALEQNPDAHIATGVPYSGRHQREQLASLMTRGGVQGNLYAARPEFIAEIRRLKLRMPIGFIREDGLVGAFAMFNLDPLANKWNKARVDTVAAAGFLFPSLKWWRLADVRLYWRRRIRYSLGHFENHMLSDLLWRKGTAAIPEDVAHLYTTAALPTLKWRGLDTLFDAIALHRIKQRRACAINALK